jgi:hypothetical protein
VDVVPAQELGHVSRENEPIHDRSHHAKR